MVAPKASNVAFNFSASSFGTFSLMILGALSTNFLASTKLAPGRIPLISLMIFALDAASNFSNLTLNWVFSGAFSYSFEHSGLKNTCSASGASAAMAPEAIGAAMA
jgi:hypothetical protein